jgi:hypothetical protein
LYDFALTDLEASAAAGASAFFAFEFPHEKSMKAHIMIGSTFLTALFVGYILQS